MQQEQVETTVAAPPACNRCGGLGHIDSYFVLVARQDNLSPVERAISREEFDRRMEARLKTSPGVKYSVPIKRIRPCLNCPPAVNRNRKNYGHC